MSALLAILKKYAFELLGGAVALVTGKGGIKDKIMAGVVGVVVSVIASPVIVAQFGITTESIADAIKAAVAVVGLGGVREIQKLVSSLGLADLWHDWSRKRLKLDSKDEPK